MQGVHEGGSTAAEAQDSFDSAILQQEGKKDSIGCMPMFQGPPKRFIRTIRPVAGSSFNVSPPKMHTVSAPHSNQNLSVRMHLHSYIGLKMRQA